MRSTLSTTRIEAITASDRGADHVTRIRLVTSRITASILRDSRRFQLTNASNVATTGGKNKRTRVLGIIDVIDRNANKN